MELKNKSTPRRELPPIKVWVSAGERSRVAQYASQAGMSLSAYLLAVGLNTPIRSVVDLSAVADLAKVNGDLGRNAGLLKLWLSDKRGQGAGASDVEDMMVEFRRLQSKASEIMSKIVYRN